MIEVLAKAKVALTLQYINVSNQQVVGFKQCYMPNISQWKFYEFFNSYVMS